ncbi:MAG: hypothetical protein LJE68_14540 [Rhodobacter sp.]|nr:hypothetical protein [Rhodobacter sp.]
MRSIAEYFRDLAADDRYFGAEPPTPDAEMLHRIAEQEINRRVEARIEDNSVILRQVEDVEDDAGETPQVAPKAAPRPDPVPAAAVAASAAAARTPDEDTSLTEPAVEEYDEVADSVAAKLARIRAAVARSRAEPEPILNAMFAEDEHAEQMPAGASIDAAFQDAATAEDTADAADDEAMAEVAETPAEAVEDAAGETADLAEDSLDVEATAAPMAEDQPAEETSAEVTEPLGMRVEDSATDEIEDVAELPEVEPEVEPVSEDFAEAGQAPEEAFAEEQMSADDTTFSDDADDAFEDDTYERAEFPDHHEDDLIGQDATEADTAGDEMVSQPADAATGIDEAEAFEETDAAEDEAEATEAEAGIAEEEAETAEDDSEVVEAETAADEVEAAEAEAETAEEEAEAPEVEAETAEHEVEAEEVEAEAAEDDEAAFAAMLDDSVAEAGDQPSLSDEMDSDENTPVDIAAVLSGMPDDHQDAEAHDDSADAKDAPLRLSDPLRIEDDTSSELLLTAELRTDLPAPGEDTASDADSADAAAGPHMRVLKMRREEFEAEFVEVDESDALIKGLIKDSEADQQAEAFADANGIRETLGDTGLSSEDEEDLINELAEVERGGGEIFEMGPRNGAGLDDDLSALDDVVEPAAPVSEEDAKVDRLLARADSALEDGEGSRRRSAIAHLKAAVAAVRADGDRARQDAEAKAKLEISQYRDDLARVVRPASPEAAAPHAEASQDAEAEADAEITAEDLVEADAELTPEETGLDASETVEEVAEEVAAEEVTAEEVEAEELEAEDVTAEEVEAVEATTEQVEAEEALTDKAEDTGNDEAEPVAAIGRPTKPVRPASSTLSSRTRRSIAPLMLVSEQRVDNDPASQLPSEPVRPRRIQTRDLDSAADTERAAGDAARGNASAAENHIPDSGDFKGYVAETGAEGIQEILEASLAFGIFVEGAEFNSRPQIMKRMIGMFPDGSVSREDGLRAFGVLLREGRIHRVKRGEFLLPESSRFHPGQAPKANTA